MWYFLLFSVVLPEIKGDGLPTGKCLPTAVEVGPCHTCVCDDKGVFNCQYNDCDNEKLNEITHQGTVPLHANQAECTPNVLYKDGILWCSCTDKKRWKSNSCRQNFYHTRAKAPLKESALSIEAISCDRGSYYVVDCNICLCKHDTLDQAYCTSRTCTEGSKIDDCKYGQVLRLDEELCTCSELGYYVDKLCIKVKGLNTKISQSDLAILTQQGVKRAPRADNLEEGQKCIPNSKFNVDCNKCWCSPDGKSMRCTAKSCPTALVNSIMEEVYHSDEAPAGQACKDGEHYEKGCRYCFCTEKNVMLCTETCDSVEKPEQDNNMMEDDDDELDGEPSKARYKVLTGSTNDNEEFNDGEEEDDFHPRAQAKKKYGFVPLTSRGRFPDWNPKLKCTPGRIYNKGCQRCFCTHENIGRCTNMPCKDMKPSVTVPKDVAPKITDAEFARLKILANEASQCKPGKTYRVLCNACLCLSNGDLLCDNKLCPSIRDINLNKAWKYTGNPCKPGDTPPADCIKCKCEDEKYKCEAVRRCVPHHLKKLSHETITELEPDNPKQKCVPGLLYKKSCNECFCTEDRALGCTRRGCLKFTEIEKLNKLRKKLMKEGL